MTHPTIEDVARLADVSIATVSRCLHTPERVAPPTRERVLAAVRQTGYNLNIAAQSLRRRRSDTVLVVVPDIGNTYFSDILGGIERVASAQGLTMLIGDTRRSKAREESYVRHLVNGRADGALLLIDPREAWFEVPAPNAKGIRPIVTISEVAPGFANTAVMIDNVAAAEAMANHLIAQGHRRIAHVTGPSTDILTRERMQGYRRALASAGLTEHADDMIPGDYSLASGRAAFDRFVAMADRPTAIFFANDESAMGFISSANLVGVRVPAEVSVAGFDDIHFAQSCTPALTTIRQPRAEMGAEAMRVLLAIIAGEAPASVCLPFELIERASTAPPAR